MTYQDPIDDVPRTSVEAQEREQRSPQPIDGLPRGGLVATSDAIALVITCLEHLLKFLGRSLTTSALAAVREAIDEVIDVLKGLASDQTSAAVNRSANAPMGLAGWQIRAVEHHIHERLQERITIGALAQTANLSPSHFTRMFQQSFGVTPMRHLRNSRVDRAKHLLAATKLPLIDIAEQCGFADQAHFTRIFQKVVGMTPRRWRLTGS